MVWAACLSGVLFVGPGMTAQSLAADTAGVRDESISTIAPLTAGDEPIIVSKHTIQSTKGRLDYEARIGRLSIRDAETGQIRGRIFFVAYVVAPKRSGHARPLTFAWNGARSRLVDHPHAGPRTAAD